MKRLKAFIPAALAAVPLLSLAADVLWLEKDRDFGLIPECGGKQTAFARFVNPGPDTLMVVDARTKCDCTYVEFPDEEILPGDTASVLMVYDPAGRPGAVRQSVRLVFSDSSTALIRLSGRVEPSSSEQQSQNTKE